MPLLDHFQPPLYPDHYWASFHSNWAIRLADALNARLTASESLAQAFTHSSTRTEIDVVTWRPVRAGGLREHVPEGVPQAAHRLTR